MNRRIVFGGLRRLLPVALWSLVVVAGCHSRTSEYDPALMAEIREKIHEVEPLALEKADPNKPAVEPNAPPPATLEMSLEQCRALALENNLQLKASLISPTIAAAQLSEEEAKFESAFFANANLIKSDQPQGRAVLVSDTPVPAVGISQIERVQADLGVQVPLRTGGTVTFDLSDTRTEDLNAGNVPFNPSFENGLSVSVSHPLLRDAGRWVNTYSIRIAAYSRDIVSARTKLDIIAVLAALDRVYWRLYAARRELEVRQQQYELSQAQLERARRLVAAGQRSQVEIIRAESGVAQQLEAIIIAENTLRDRERELKRVINKAGLDMQTRTVIVPATLPDPIRYDLEQNRLIRQAMDSRMELLELQLQLLQDAEGIDFARNQTLPAASLDYTYNISGTGETRNESFDMLGTSDFVNHRLGLQVFVPIGNEAAKSRLRRAIYERRQGIATKADREEIIKLEVLNAIDQVEANWQRILAARQNTIVNARLYEAEQREYEVGMSTSTDVLDAQFNFANAQTSEIRALADYQISLIDVAYATGTILGAARIQWEPIVPPAEVD